VSHGGRFTSWVDWPNRMMLMMMIIVIVFVFVSDCDCYCCCLWWLKYWLWFVFACDCCCCCCSPLSNMPGGGHGDYENDTVIYGTSTQQVIGVLTLKPITNKINNHSNPMKKNCGHAFDHYQKYRNCDVSKSLSSSSSSSSVVSWFGSSLFLLLSTTTTSNMKRKEQRYHDPNTFDYHHKRPTA